MIKTLLTTFVVILVCAGVSYADEPEVEVSITFADQLFFGNLYQFKMALKNNTGKDHTNLLVRIQIPAGIKYQDNMNGCIIKWEIEKLQADASVKHEFFLEPVVNESHDYYLRSGVFSETSDILFVNDSVMNVEKSHLSLEPVIVPETMPENSPVNYEFILTNTGYSKCQNISVETYLSGEIKFKRATPKNYDYIPDFSGKWEKIKFPEIIELNHGKKVHFKIKCDTVKQGKGEFVFRVNSGCGSHILMKHLEIRNN